VTGDHRGASIRPPDADPPPPPEPGDDGYITEQDIRRAVARWEELAPLDDDDPPPTAKI
jgi:hypothetical protein